MRRPWLLFSSCWWMMIIGLLLVSDASCLALDHTGASKLTRAVSTKQDGGHVTVYPLDGPSEATKSALKGFSIGSSLRSIKSGFRSTFLPSGFPQTTPPGYLRYSVWSWIQDLCTQLRSVLATQRVLEGVGVGREGATALSALLNFIVRDGCGMAANLLFTSVAASKFSSDIKRWRLFADIMVDLGITMEVVASSLPPQMFLPLLCLGNSCKALCGVAAGACGGAINLHWAKGSDVADIQAKFGAQHTVTGSLGLIFAALFAKSVSTVNSRAMWTLYASLTVLHIFANIQCMRVIHFDTLNVPRLRLVMENFFSSRVKEQSPQKCSPSKIAAREPLVFLPSTRWPAIKFGVSFDEFVRIGGGHQSRLTDEASLSKPYYVSVSEARRPVVAVSLSHDCTPTERIRAYFHATILARSVQSNTNVSVSLEDAQAEVDNTWESFALMCRADGWDLSKAELGTGGYQVRFE